ncbi:hypothetical protein FKP32DRAFT_1678085 [Trametes sanguinea]|nr:hypothetical protein FKP32DRAFT_1678085 [Trametes sanguinea]
MSCRPEDIVYSAMPCIEAVVLTSAPTWEDLGTPLPGWGRFLAKMFPDARRVRSYDSGVFLFELTVGGGRDAGRTSCTTGTWQWLDFLEVHEVEPLLSLELTPCEVSYLEVITLIPGSDDDIATAFANIRASRAFPRMPSLERLTVDLSQPPDIQPSQNIEDVIQTHFHHLQHSVSITDLFIRLHPAQVELGTRFHSEGLAPSFQLVADRAEALTGPEFPGYERALRALSDSVRSLRRISFIISESPLRKPTFGLLPDDPSDFKELDELGGPDVYEAAQDLCKREPN